MDSTTVYVTEQVRIVLSQLAQSFGTTVEYLWPVIVKAAFAKALADLFVIMIMWFATWRLFRSYKKRLNDITVGPECPNANDYCPFKMVHATIMWAMLTTSIIFTSCTITNTMIGLVSPEYKALEMILLAFGNI